MTEQFSENASTGGMHRRQMLAMGGAAAVAAAGATVIGSSAAGADPLAPLLLPTTPFRLYDSRQAGGRISGGQLDVLTTANPAEDLAFLLNVTVVGTAGTGWLNIFSADDTTTQSSTINWFAANQTMVNTAYTWIRQSDQGIKVSCGGAGSTQYILDLTGVLTMVDLAIFATPTGARSTTAARGEFTATRTGS